MQFVDSAVLLVDCYVVGGFCYALVRYGMFCFSMCSARHGISRLCFASRRIR